MDEAAYRGRETETQALGKTWRLSRWTLNVLDEFNDWARTQLPDPLAVADKAVERLQLSARRIRQQAKLKPTDKDHLDENEAAFLLQANAEQQERHSRNAMDEATSYLSLQSRQFQSLLNSARGVARLLFLLLRDHHPDIDEDTAFAVASCLDEEEVKRIMQVTSGRGGGQGNADAPASSGAA